MRHLLFRGVCALILAAQLTTVLAQEKPETDLSRPLLSLQVGTRTSRCEALRRIGAHGTAGKQALPAVLKVLCEEPDNAVATHAIQALAQIGWPAVPELMKLARAPHPNVRHRAVASLCRMGPLAAPALDILKDALHDPHKDTRLCAIVALGDMGSLAEPAIPNLCLLLRDRDRKVRELTSLALQRLGAAVVPSLGELLKDRDVAVRRAALEALEQFGPEAGAALPALIEILQSAEPEQRAAAARALGSIGPRAEPAMPHLLQAMRFQRSEVQMAAFQAVLRIGSQDMPALLAELQKVNADTDWATPLPMPQFGSRPADVVAHLQRQLLGTNKGERLAAALALLRLGPLSKSTAAALQQLQQDRSPVVRQSALLVQSLASGTLATPAVQYQLERNLLQIQQETLACTLRRQQQEQQAAAARKPKLPLNRQALFDPNLQTEYKEIVERYIALVIHQAKCQHDRRVRLELLTALERERLAARSLVVKLPAEAAPALLHGMSLVVAYNLGFC